MSKEGDVVMVGEFQRLTALSFGDFLPPSHTSPSLLEIMSKGRVKCHRACNILGNRESWFSKDLSKSLVIVSLKKFRFHLEI